MTHLPYIHDLFDPDKFAGEIFYAILCLFLAWLAGRIIRIAVKRLIDWHLPMADRTAVNFIGHLARALIYIVAFLSYSYLNPILHRLGSVWLASVGVASVVVGLAAQSTLSNLIAGISLLLYRPFKLGDQLQVSTPAGLLSGTVENISLGYTIIQTADNRRIVVPNSLMASTTCINAASQSAPPAVCTVDLTLRRDADLDKVRKILADIRQSHPSIPPIQTCRVTAITDAGITLTITTDVPPNADIPRIKSDLLESAKSRFDAEGIPFAYTPAK